MLQPEIDYSYLGGGYIFPRSDEIVLGGTFDRDNWSPDVNREQANSILLAVGLSPRLIGKKTASRSNARIFDRRYATKLLNYVSVGLSPRLNSIAAAAAKNKTADAAKNQSV